jgi:hypothetical protein
MKERIFVGPQITEFADDRNLDEVLEGIGKTACEAFRLVTDSFLGSHKGHLTTDSWWRKYLKPSE